MTAAEPIPFRLHLMLAIQRAQRSGHLAFAGTLVAMLREIEPARVPTCKHCGRLADWVRTRYFETEDADVWECNTPGCSSNGLIICHTSKPKELNPGTAKGKN